MFFVVFTFHGFHGFFMSVQQIHTSNSTRIHGYDFLDFLKSFMVQHIHVSTLDFHISMVVFTPKNPQFPNRIFFSHYGDEPLCVCQEFTLCDPQMRKYDIWNHAPHDPPAQRADAI